MSKKFWKRISVLFMILSLLLAAGCSGKTGKSPITIDENGIASWEPIEGAVQYEYCIVDRTNTTDGSAFTTETSVQLPKGYCLHVRAVMENGETGEWIISDYYGDEGDGDGFTGGEEYIDQSYDLKWTDVSSYDVIANIDHNTVKALDNGGVYFEAAGPNGGMMRFEGTKGVSVTPEGISFEADAKIAALDAIGRICAVEAAVSDAGTPGNLLKYTGGYTFTDKTNVDSMDELFYIWGFSITSEESPESQPVKMTHMNYQPNFIAFSADGANADAFTISELTVYYDETTYQTGVRMMALDRDYYVPYMEGDMYDASRERYDSANGIFDFYLMLLPEVANEVVPFNPDPLVDDVISRSIIDIPQDRFAIGEMKDAAGNVLDKVKEPLKAGYTLEITVGDVTMDMQLPVLERYRGAQTLHELTPFNNELAEGQVTALVIPIVWADEQDRATDQLLNDIYNELGMVVDEKGKTKDYSENLKDRFSLSDYYAKVSYGKYQLQSFVTDWYQAPFTFADMKNVSVLDEAMQQEVKNWLHSTYPDMDWSKFDGNGDGIFDSVIWINAGCNMDFEIMMNSFSGAAHASAGYTGENAGRGGKVEMKNFISVNASYLGSNTLIHEYGHAFGLVDYYDVSYSGIDAVGRFDMQSTNVGDWNAYSKYAAGWIKPEIVAGLASGESKEITIGSLATTGDAIVIPAVGAEFDGPFNEYILVDLFTAEELNQYDAAASGLDKAAGVRIYHVNSVMEKRTLTGTDGVKYPIGTVHFTNMFNKDGMYLLELIQAGKKNTFTDLNNLRTDLQAEDLFKAGDTFTVKDYAEFFVNGRMDDGSDFGYSIQVVSIEQNAAGEYSAVIRITRE